MERLADDQSALLKRIYDSSISYNSLSDSDKLICRFLLDLGYVSCTTINKSSDSGGVFRSWSEIDTVSISESGKMYLIYEKLSVDELLYLQSQMNALRELADTANKQAELAKSDSVAARKDAFFSKIVSVISLAISITAILIPILARLC